MPPLRRFAVLSGATLAGCLGGLTVFALYDKGAHVRWGASVMAALFLVVCADLAVHGATVLRRAARVDLELMLARFKARSAQRFAGGPAAALAHLRAAGRLSWGGRRRRAIAQVLRELPADPAAALAAIAERAPALAAPRTARWPTLRARSAAPGWTLTAALVFALLSVVLRPLGIGLGLWTLAGLLQAAALFPLFWSGLDLARRVSARLRERVAKSSFRVLLVSRERGPGVTAARALYSDVAALIHITVEDDAELELAWAVPSGDQAILVDRTGADYALEAFAPGADLVVLATEDPDVAAQVLAAADTLPDRRLYLGREDATPPGFRWVEPLALSALAAGRRVTPQTDLYRLGVPKLGAAWSSLVLRALLAFGVFSVALRGGVYLAILFWLAAAAYLAPNLIGPVRRAAISRERLRAPLAPAASLSLDPRRLEWRLRLAVLLLSVAAVAVMQVPVLARPGETALQTLLVKLSMSPPLLAVIDFGLVSGLLFIVKWRRDWSFRALVLRRNAQRHGYGHKVAVMAGCGRYAQVVSIRDDTLDLTDTGFGERRESSLGYWFQIFSEIEATLVPARFLHPWQRQVRLELEVADIAVFDWIDEITDNMRWELAAAAERLPPHRLLIVHSPQNAPAVVDALAQLKDTLATAPHCLEATRGPDDEYVWSRHDAFGAAFLACFHAAVAPLVPEPRPAFECERPGAWPLPIPTRP